MERQGSGVRAQGSGARRGQSRLGAREESACLGLAEPRTLDPDPSRCRRRGTVLVFVMAILVLLALLGLGMMIATRGERQNTVPQREAQALEAIMDRAILVVRERLRDDLVADPNVLRDPDVLADPNQFDPNTLLAGHLEDPNLEGEPYDAPCKKDRWLASTVPWPLSWYDSFGPSVPDPNRTFVWPHVSFLGGEPNGIYRWDMALGSQDPNDALTNRVTAEQDPNWSQAYAADPNLLANVILVDADGDGIADSPISFTFPVDSAAPTDQPKRVHVAIRIVDNCSKINVCTAGLNDPDFERRGRLINDIVFDPNTSQSLWDAFCPTLDASDDLSDTGDPTTVAGYRSARLQLLGYPAAYATDPNLFYAVIRGPLFLGGAPGLFSPYVETELTRRNVLISAKAYLDGPTTLLERSLRLTLAPRNDDPNDPNDPPDPPDPNIYQWRRVDDPSLYATFMASDTLKGIFRRSLYTARSFDVLRRRPLTLPPLGGTLYYLNGQSSQWVLIFDRAERWCRDRIGMEKLDLNYLNADDAEMVKESLIGLSNYLYGGKIAQGADVDTRLRSAYQLALNIVDYRDPDDEPTVLTSRTAPTQVAFAGVEQQPFLTEGYVLWAAAGDPVVVTKHVAVELFLPAGWLSDGANLDRFLLKSGAANAIKLSAFTGSPALTPGAYQVFANVVDPDPPGLINRATYKYFSDTFDVVTGGVTLLYDPDGAGPIQPYPIDHLDAPASSEDFWVTAPELADGEWELRTIQRNTTDWRFTVGVCGNAQISRDDPDLPTLGGENNPSVAPADTQIAPCFWWFKNLDWPDDPNDRTDPNRMAFDSPGDLSRVLAVGSDPNDPNSATPVKLRNAQIYYRDTLGKADPNDWVAAGRLDFMLHDPNRPIDPNDPNGVPTNVFDYFTTIAASTDSIDNDGDGLIDLRDIGANQTESDDIDYRVPGRININTASEFVLRTVPFFYIDDTGTASDVIDVAGGIVTFREARRVPSLTSVPTLLTTPPPKGDWFRTLGDLTRVRTSNTVLAWNGSVRNVLDCFGADNEELADLPDYDAETGDPNEANGIVDDVRERDILLARSANLLTVRSDTYTVYIALIDSVPNPDGSMRYLRRCQFTLDRVNCFRNPVELPQIIGRVDTNYYDDTR